MLVSSLKLGQSCIFTTVEHMGPLWFVETPLRLWWHWMAIVPWKFLKEILLRIQGLSLMAVRKLLWPVLLTLKSLEPTRLRTPLLTKQEMLAPQRERSLSLPRQRRRPSIHWLVPLIRNMYAFFSRRFLYYGEIQHFSFQQKFRFMPHFLVILNNQKSSSKQPIMLIY